MPDIAASDVTYTVGNRFHQPSMGYVNEVTVAFGNGTLTYPAGGVPLTKARMGCPASLDFVLTDPGSANGFLYKFDKVNEKIRIYQGDNDNAGDAALIELVGGAATPAAATLRGRAIGY